MAKKASWRLPVCVFLIVFTAILGFVFVQSWIKGRIPEPALLDMQLAQHTKHARASLHPQSDEPYHYDFFALLDKPVTDHHIPDFELAQNPAIKAKARHALKKITGKFAVQVSSFKNASDAQTLARQLNAQGFYAVSVPENIKGETWYRVRIDGGAQREQAESLVAKVQKKTGIKGFVVSL